MKQELIGQLAETTKALYAINHDGDVTLNWLLAEAGSLLRAAQRRANGLTDGPTPRDVRSVLKSRYGAMSRLAKELGVGPSVVANALSGRKSSKRVMDAALKMAEEITAEREGR